MNKEVTENKYHAQYERYYHENKSIFFCIYMDTISSEFIKKPSEHNHEYRICMKGDLCESRERYK
jgi:hypothetical protein